MTKSLLQMLETFFDARSKREKFLFSIALGLSIYFFAFHSRFSNFIEQILQLRENIKQSQIYLKSNQTKNIAQELSKTQYIHAKLTELTQTINSQSLCISATLEKINNYALLHKIVFWEVDTKDENSNYEIFLSGNTSFADFFSFLDFVEKLPLIHVLSFEISKNGDFKLGIKNHQILSKLSPNPSLSIDFVFQKIRQAMQKEELIFLNQSSHQKGGLTQTPLELEALLNKKAKINGNWLKEGENIEGYTLKKIQNNQVILHSKGNDLKLQLIKKRVF